MEVTIEHTGAVRFEAEARGHKIVCDQPVENGGADEGMTPPEFLLAALGTCAGFYAAQYLKTRQLSQAGLQVRVVADKKTAPARLDSFRIELTVPGLAAEHEAGVLRSVKACLIHNTLLNSPHIETALVRDRQTEAA
jgi:putative redox protein